MLFFNSSHSQVCDIVPSYQTKKRVRILKADCSCRPHLLNIFFFNRWSGIWFVAKTFLPQIDIYFLCIASLKLLRSQCLKIFRGRSCLLPVDMAAPESTFVNHCGKFAMFPVYILGLCFLLSSSLFLERSAWEAAVLLALKLHGDWVVCSVFPWTKIAMGVRMCLCLF